LLVIKPLLLLLLGLSLADCPNPDTWQSRHQGHAEAGLLGQARLQNRHFESPGEWWQHGKLIIVQIRDHHWGLSCAVAVSGDLFLFLLLFLFLFLFH
jgi:hypothetical protein